MRPPWLAACKTPPLAIVSGGSTRPPFFCTGETSSQPRPSGRAALAGPAKASATRTQAPPLARRRRCPLRVLIRSLPSASAVVLFGVALALSLARRALAAGLHLGLGRQGAAVVGGKGGVGFEGGGAD